VTRIDDNGTVVKCRGNRVAQNKRGDVGYKTNSHFVNHVESIGTYAVTHEERGVGRRGYR
jgi:hypothetical protein